MNNVISSISSRMVFFSAISSFIIKKFATGRRHSFKFCGTRLNLNCDVRVQIRSNVRRETFKISKCCCRLMCPRGKTASVVYDAFLFVILENLRRETSVVGSAKISFVYKPDPESQNGSFNRVTFSSKVSKLQSVKHYIVLWINNNDEGERAAE